MANFSQDVPGDFGVPGVNIEPTLSAIYDPYSGIDLRVIRSCDYVELVTFSTGERVSEQYCDDPFAANGPVWFGGSGQPGRCRNDGRVNARFLGSITAGKHANDLGYWSWIASCPDSNTHGCTGNPGPHDRFSAYEHNYYGPLGPAMWGHFGIGDEPISGDPSDSTYYRLDTRLQSSRFGIAQPEFHHGTGSPPGFPVGDFDLNAGELRWYWTPDEDDFLYDDNRGEPFRFAQAADDWYAMYVDNGCGGELLLGNGGEHTDDITGGNPSDDDVVSCDTGFGDKMYGGGLGDYNHSWFDKTIYRYCDDGRPTMYRFLVRHMDETGNSSYNCGYQTWKSRQEEGTETYQNIAGNLGSGQGAPSTKSGVKKISPTYTDPLVTSENSIGTENGDGVYYRTDANSLNISETPYYLATDNTTLQEMIDYVRGIDCDTEIDKDISDFNAIRAVCKDGSYVEMGNNQDNTNQILTAGVNERYIELGEDFTTTISKRKTETGDKDSHDDDDETISTTISNTGFNPNDMTFEGLPISRIEVTKIELAGDFNNSWEYLYSFSIGGISFTTPGYNGGRISIETDTQTRQEVNIIGGYPKLLDLQTIQSDGVLRLRYKVPVEVDSNGNDYNYDLKVFVKIYYNSEAIEITTEGDYEFLSGEEACQSITEFNSDMYYLSDADNRPSLGLFATTNNNITNDNFQSNIANPLFDQVLKKQLVPNGNGRYVQQYDYNTNILGANAFRPRGDWGYVNLDGYGLNLTEEGWTPGGGGYQIGEEYEEIITKENSKYYNSFDELDEDELNNLVTGHDTSGDGISQANPGIFDVDLVQNILDGNPLDNLTINSIELKQKLNLPTDYEKLDYLYLNTDLSGDTYEFQPFGLFPIAGDEQLINDFSGIRTFVNGGGLNGTDGPEKLPDLLDSQNYLDIDISNMTTIFYNDFPSYLEEFDLNNDGLIDEDDVNGWNDGGRPDVAQYCNGIIAGVFPIPLTLNRATEMAELTPSQNGSPGTLYGLTNFNINVIPNVPPIQNFDFDTNYSPPQQHTTTIGFSTLPKVITNNFLEQNLTGTVEVLNAYLRYGLTVNGPKSEEFQDVYDFEIKLSYTVNAGLNFGLQQYPNNPVQKRFIQHPEHEPHSSGVNPYAGFYPYAPDVNRSILQNIAAEWAYWVEDAQCYSFNRCLKFRATDKWADLGQGINDVNTNPFYQSSIDKGGDPTLSNGSNVLRILSIARYNQYRTINQTIEIYKQGQTTINPYSGLKISFWMKTISDEFLNINNPPKVNATIKRNASPSTGKIDSNTDFDYADLQKQTKDIYTGLTYGKMYTTNYLTANGLNNSKRDSSTMYETFDSSASFKNENINRWEKKEFIFNLPSQYTLSDNKNIQSLHLILQADSDFVEGFQGTVYIDDIEVVESYEFKPDVDVRKKKGPNNYGLADLTKYYDPNILDQFAAYKDTLAPLEAQFYFYPRYIKDNFLEKTPSVIQNDFRYGMFYLYNVDWGDDSPIEFIEPIELGENVSVYHTYERAGIYEIKGTMLRMKPDKNYKPVGVIHNENFVLRINVNEDLDEDFEYFSDNGFSFIPYKNTSPIVGGYSIQSSYYNSIKRQLGIVDLGGNEQNYQLVNTNFKNTGDRLRTEIALDKMNSIFTEDLELLQAFKQERFDGDELIYNGIKTLSDELGKSIGDCDITEIRYFNKPIQIWEMFGFEEVNEFLDDNVTPNINHHGLINSPKYWKNIIPKDYSIFNREGIYYSNGYINEFSNQDWLNLEYYYPVLPKYGKDGKFLDGVFPNRLGEEKVPFPSDGPITDEDILDDNLKIYIGSDSIENNVFNDNSGEANYGFVINDYKPNFTNETLEPRKIKQVTRVRTSKANGAF